MIQDWISNFFENRSWLGLMQYNQSSGLITAGGTSFSGLASHTWAEFTDINFDLTVARHVVVTDRHSTRDPSATPGSLWYIDPTATSARKRQLRSAPIRLAQSGLPTQSDYPYLRVFCTDWGTYGADIYTDGTNWILERNTILHKDNVRSTLYIVPATTFVGTYTISNSGGLTKIKSSGAGAHSLTAGIAVGASIYISAGTGWTTGFHTITDVSVADEIIINTAYDAGFGSPTITLAGGSAVTLESVTLPPMSANSDIEIDLTSITTNSANNKNLVIKYGGTSFYVPTYASGGGVTRTNRALFSINNRNSLTAQVASSGNLSTAGVGGSSQDCNTGTVSSGSAQTLLFTFAPATHNEIVGFERYKITGCP